VRRFLGGGAVAAVLLASLTAVTGQQSASALVDTDPPAIGSCHNLTYDEVRGVSSDKPPVPCGNPHTTLTFDVVEYADPPDWNDEDTYAPEVYDQCNPSWVEVLGGNPKAIQRSSYTYYWLLPTPAQRDAGAAWVRCELVLSAGGSIARLPQQVTLGGLPLPDAVARCRESEANNYRVTVCARAHQYRATQSIKLPWSRWRGYDAAQNFAYRECNERIRGRFYYQWPSSRYWWRLGFRHATCLRKTTA
jgi:hypothetical protein